MNDTTATSRPSPRRQRLSAAVIVLLGLLGMSASAAAWAPAPSTGRADSAAQAKSPKADVEVVRGATFERSARHGRSADRTLALCSPRFQRPSR